MLIHKDKINKKICEDLINVFEKSKDTIKEMSHEVNMTSLFLDKNDTCVREYFYHLNLIKNKYIKKYIYLNLGQEPWNVCKDVKIQKYEPGEAYFGWHAESTGFKNNNDRILVYSTFLNNVKYAGETEFFYQKEKIKPRQGTTILFPAFWTHAHRGKFSTETKYIITGWYTYE